MALLTAKLDPKILFDDLDVSDAAVNAALASYTRISSTKAIITLSSLSGDGVAQDYTLTVFGTGLPSSLANPGLDALFASISSATLARNTAPSTILFSWDGAGTKIPLTSLGSAVESGDPDRVLNLFLGGEDTLNADYQDVDISLLQQLENISLIGSAQNATGNDQANLIQGNLLSNLILCLGGNDVARGAEGDDTLLGGAGNDSLAGGLRNDRLEGEVGNDAARGGNGRDTLIGGAGRDELWGDFGLNHFEANNDGESDLLVIKSDQLMFNQLINGIDNSGGAKCDVIGKIDSIDKVIIQGAATAQLTFQQSYSWQNPITSELLSGIAIFAAGKLEALYTGGDLTLAQIQSITTGDGSAAAINNTQGYYGIW